MAPSCTLFVNSTDSFADCWPPFFDLLAHYWPGNDWPVVLNTETRDYAHPGLPLHCTRVGATYAGSARQWTAALRAGLDRVATDYFLYVQEDYFLNAPVNVDLLDRLLAITEREQYSHVRLVPFPCGPAYRPHPHYGQLLQIPQRADYRISLQAGLWRKASLLSYLRDGETPWQLEILGTERSHRRADSFYMVNPAALGAHEVFPYTPTGIIKGQWNRSAVEELFARHRIAVDYSARGFWVPPHPLRAWLLRRRHVAGKLVRRWTGGQRR